MADDTILDLFAKTRAQAKVQGSRFYFSGQRCKNGHTAERYTSTGGCVPCQKAWHWARSLDPEVAEKSRETSRWKMRARRADPVENAKIKASKRKSQKKHWRKGRAKFLARLAGTPKPKECETCGSTKRRICFDHCHKTGKFRGWICARCNTMLGWVEDDPALLRNLATYLEKSLDDANVIPVYMRPELE